MSEISMYSKHFLSNNNIEKIITVTIVTCFPYVKMANDSIVITCHFAKYFRQVGSKITFMKTAWKTANSGMHRQIYSSLTKFSVSLELEVQCVPLASVLAFLAGGLSESVQLDIYKSTKEKCVTRFKRQIID